MRKNAGLRTKIYGLIIAIALAGCGHDASYELVDLSELPMEFEMGFSQIGVTPGNVISAMTGHARSLTVAGTAVALVPNQQLTVGGTNVAFIVTEEYGKVKVVMNADSTWIFWLTPSQKARFMRLKKVHTLETGTKSPHQSTTSASVSLGKKAYTYDDAIAVFQKSIAVASTDGKKSLKLMLDHLEPGSSPDNGQG